MCVVLVALLAWAIASIGGPLTPAQAGATVIDRVLFAGWPGLLYIASSIGLGRVALPLFRAARQQLAIQAAVGLSLQLSLGHAINTLGGFFPGLLWNIVSLAPCAAGVILLAPTLRAMKTGVRTGTGMAVSAVCMLPVAIMLVAASQAPGLLWGSEFGGFDVLSYHLQLPREWLDLGRLRPVEHNVYSFLPSYFESAFLTLQLWTFAPRTGADGVSGIFADDGWRALACQMLHVWFGLGAAWIVVAITRELASRQRDDGEAPESAVGAAAFMAIPWVVVVGSMAYNELAMAALLAGALLVAVDRGVMGASRGIGAGWLLGVACGIKPTALIFGAPATGIALVWFAPMSAWAITALGAAIAGLVALAPWMLRNWLVCGNPVFPYVHGIFGLAHWSSEQYERFAGAHHFGGPWSDRLRLLFMLDPTDPAGPRHRGMMHPQWSIFFPLVGVGAVIALVIRRTHRAAALLVLLLLSQIVAWLVATHLQSRFLIPLAVPGAALIGLAAGAPERALARRMVALGLLLATLFAAVRALDTYWSERGGRPNQQLAFPPAAFVQRSLREGERPALKPGERLYLLGDSTPFYFPGPLVYHTTWDRSPLGEAMSQATWTKDGPDPGEVSRTLLARGIGAVLVNQSELDRLISARWYDSRLGMFLIADWIRRGTRVEDGGNDLPLIVRPIDPKASKP